LAGIIPGLITLAAISIYAVTHGIKTKRPRTPFVLGEAISALSLAKWELLLPVVLLTGMFTGALRIHEAAAFTALYVLVIEVWVYKDISLREDLPRVIRESMTLVGAILAILALAIGFTAYLIQAGVPMMILDAMGSFITSPTMFLLVLNVFLLIVGMLMDIFSAIVVVVPLIIPIANEFGIDPYHLGVVFLLNLEIGYLTPPVGLNLFISSFRFGKPISQLYGAVMPYIGLLVFSLVLTTYIPVLSTGMASLYGETLDRDDMVPAEERGADPNAPLEDLGGLDLDDLSAEGDELSLDDLTAEVDDAAPEPTSELVNAPLEPEAPAAEELAPID
ncbi:MAG: TRAP transporter large permease subunit, partial [Polyangiaceae bacterium]|nr:TRAP transporter large permease subunit [Polyangiaceae bacterium]